MSLETAISELKDAVRALTATVQNGAAIPEAAKGAQAPVKGAKPKAPKAPAADTAPDSKDVYKMFLELGKQKGRTAIEDALSEFGVANAQALKPSQYQGVIHYINEQLAE
jgi:hypothetical protein